MIKKGDTLLFIGDSITDVGRKRYDEMDLGEGFPKLIAKRLEAEYPDYNLTILNRGISGDRVHDLKMRWQDDCLALQPDVVTILVGINDVFFTVDKHSTPTEQELKTFESNYRYLLDTIQTETEAQIVLMEPFVLPYPADRMHWRDHLDPRIQIVRRLAHEYDAWLVPLDGLLNAKGIVDGFATYTGDDGIHPTALGHQAIADAWFTHLNL